MGYYQGDFYRGDFYRGDPGFFSFLGGLAKKAVGFIPGVGPIASKAIDVVSKATSVVKSSKVGTAIIKHPVLSAAGAAGVVGAAGGAVASRMGGASRSSLPKMGGAGALRGGGGGGRHRRMRVTNPKALRRAIRRAEGFKRLALRVLKFTGGHHKGRAYFKHKRRRRT